MNRKQFGKVVKSLRKEHFDWETNRVWTQKRLADEANLSLDIAEKIEGGKRKILQGEELQQLASALKLSTLERREFFAIAAEVDMAEIIKEEANDEANFSHVWHHLASTRQPAYLFSSLYDLVGINAAMMAFHGLTRESLLKMRESDLGCNVLGLLFARNAALRTAMSREWQQIAISNIYQFHFTSLPYRYTKRYGIVTRELRKLPDYSRLSMETRLHSQDYFSQLRDFQYTHHLHGPVHYGVSMTSTLTRCGHLYLSTFTAYDKQTDGLFDKFAQRPGLPLRVMPWPIEEMI